MFTTQVGGRDFRGWSATVDEMQTILLRLGIDAATTGPAVSPAVVAENDELLQDCRLDHPHDQWMHRLHSAADRPERAALREALTTLRDAMPAPGPHAAQMLWVRDPDPGAELQAWLSERVTRVNAAAPQVRRISVFGSKVVPQVRYGSAARAYYLDWVDPTQIASTPDPQRWGEFDRTEPARRTLAELCVALHAVTTPADLDAWIDRRLIGGTTQPVNLERIEGPAGPLYAVRGDGTHRAHFARIFGLPLLALIRTSTLPRPLRVFDRPEVEGAPFGRWASLWHGLREQGLLEVVEHPGPGMASWTPTRTCGEWMLMNPQEATAVNRAYDRAYPHALQSATGLSDGELFDPEQWARKLLGSTRSRSHRGRWSSLTELVHTALSQRAGRRQLPRTIGSITGTGDAP
ncbi:hypothetical protein [Nocardia canadensis]|uniref:hypothetical protein n=1 Tax=Nocardia canadensis TaxID=3065238 RepID=UPI00292EDCC3|nr:hypothetical protein [Nocardia canadensis]